MNIGFIGAGNVGSSVGKFFYENGFEITGYYSRTISSAEKAASEVNSIPFFDLKILIKKTDILAITTPDDQIEDIVDKLSKTDCDWRQKIVFHMSGAVSSAILTPLAEKGATIISLHPMLSIISTTTADEIKSAHFTLEGTGEKVLLLENTLKKLGLKLLNINPKDKVLYHAAATVASNYLVTIIDISLEILNHINIEEEQARQLLKPLVEKTLMNVIQNGTEKALTGPISRGDLATVSMHIKALSAKSTELKEIYRLLGAHTLNLAQRREGKEKIDLDFKQKLEEVLKDE